MKLLPRRDRWQMLEGLFIFCLLIRAANRGGGGVTGLTKRERRVPEEIATFTSRPRGSVGREFFTRGRSGRRQGCAKGPEPAGE